MPSPWLEGEEEEEEEGLEDCGESFFEPPPPPEANTCRLCTPEVVAMVDEAPGCFVVGLGSAATGYDVGGNDVSCELVCWSVEIIPTVDNDPDKVSQKVGGGVGGGGVGDRSCFGLSWPPLSFGCCGLSWSSLDKIDANDDGDFTGW